MRISYNILKDFFCLFKINAISVKTYENTSLFLPDAVIYREIFLTVGRELGE